jgi:ABC-2 type transport system permease protein
MTPTLAPQADSTRRYGASYMGSLATLFGLTLRQYVHGKRWVAMAALFLVPAGLATLIRTTEPEAPPLVLEFALAMMFIPQLVLPLTALIYASGMMQDEQEEQTITYLLIRPLPKWAIYVVKWLATVTTTVALTAVFTALTFAAIYAGAGSTGIADPEAAGLMKRCLVTIGVHALAVTTYCSLFGLLGLVLKRTLVVGIVYTVVVEGLLANMPFGIRLMTVIYYTRIIAYRTLSYELSVPERNIAEDLAGEAWQLGVRSDPNLLAHPATSTCIAVLLVASFVCTLLAAWICSQREFHVKTPEKG